jgi:hypothetical protein
MQTNEHRKYFTKPRKISPFHLGREEKVWGKTSGCRLIATIFTPNKIKSKENEQ